MNFLLLFCFVQLFVRRAFGDICDFEHDTRTYFCKNIREVFPNLFYGNYHLQCVKCNIGTFSNKTFAFSNNLLSFNVSESGIRHVTARAFSPLSNVQYIYLQNNDLQDIAPEAFWGLRQVYEVHLENNHVEEIVPGFLADLETNSVDLKNNKIKTLPDRVFEGTLRLLILDLSKNAIKSIQKDAFLGLDDLEILDLANNKICYLNIGLFKHLTTLRQLNLADNKLSKLSIGTFSGLKNLNFLNIANNSISVFDGDALIPFNHLSKLDVAGNGIYYFDAYSVHSNVPTIKALRIDDNIFSCTQLINVIKYFKKAHVEVVTSAGRYGVQNINGIACVEMEITHPTEFKEFLLTAASDAQKSISYC